MANEDFTTYTEVDPNSRISVTASRITFTGLTIDESAYVYKDYGASYFSGAHESLLTFRASAQSAAGGWLIWALTNDVDDWQGLIDANKTIVGVMLNAGGADRHIGLTGLNAGNQVGALPGYVYTFDTTYYLKVVIDPAVGANGTIYLYIYSNAARTTLLNTQSYALSAALAGDYRYIFGIMSRNFTAGFTVSGYVEDLSFTLASTPTVTNQAVTAISGTTATGNSNITSLGFPDPTAHGVCWKTYAAFVADGLEPTTSDSKTDEGAVAATGAFTTPMTGLIAGIKYRLRAYATNIQGTGYSNAVEFTADKGTVSPDPDTQPLLRVSGIRRTFFAGSGGKSTYQTVLTLGGMSTLFISPISEREERSVVTPTPLPSGTDYSETAFVRWKINNDIADITRVFGFIPDYRKWLEWRRKGGGL